MTTIDILKIRQELVTFLRNQDLMASKTQTSVEVRGVTTFTETFTLLAAQTDFFLPEAGLKNVRSVELNSVPLDYGKQYDYDIETQIVVVSATTVATDVIEVVYDAGSGDKIYPDYPRLDLDLTSYPRIGFDDISHANDEQALNAGLIQTDILFSLIVYADKKRTVLEIWTRVRNAIIANKKTFFHFDFVTLAGAGPMAQSAGRNDKIVQKNQDFRVPYEFEAG